MKKFAVMFAVLAAALVLGQGSDEGNSSNNGELDARVSRGPKAAISKEQKRSIDGATAKFAEARAGLEGLQSGDNLLLALGGRGPTTSATLLQVREDWLTAMKAIVDQLRGLQSGFSMIRPSDEAFFELDYRIVRSTATRMSQLVDGCANFADRTSAYMAVLPDTPGNREVIVRSVTFLEDIVSQMDEIKKVLGQIAEANLAKGKRPSQKKPNGP